MILNVIYINIDSYLHCFSILINFYHNTFRYGTLYSFLIHGDLNKEAVPELHVAVLFLIIMWLLAYLKLLCGWVEMEIFSKHEQMSIG